MVFVKNGKLLLMFLISLKYPKLTKSKFLGENFCKILKSISHFLYHLSRSRIVFVNIYHERIMYKGHDSQYIDPIINKQTFELRSNRWIYTISLTMKDFFCFVFTYIFLSCQINLHRMVLKEYFISIAMCLCLTLIWHLNVLA